MQLENSQLYLACEPVDFTRSLSNLRLAQRMIQTMIREHGIGLAANQVGVNLRLFVMYVDGEFFHCFDPSIVDHSELTISSKEGCLSFPGETCEVARYATIRARFANASGHYQERDLHGLAARCFQHELDHLSGITMHSRVQDDRQKSYMGAEN
jgi:peptide deformylase